MSGSGFEEEKTSGKVFSWFLLDRERGGGSGRGGELGRAGKEGRRERERERESWAGVGLRGRKERRREAVVLKF